MLRNGPVGGAGGRVGFKFVHFGGEGMGYNRGFECDHRCREAERSRKT